ncbi:helix-turn-helix domain-containing protein [Allosalinactinospora lopnorensis]|uniref:helix-turn-helix domain-containing protein n=1 Tax=Allosalinactinospora lopnorensis TaxID=1352348 RepID=UPI0006985D94|nr:helix-turn-helix domain-containing protein [Allosalinactinospora lopnorensis]
MVEGETGAGKLALLQGVHGSSSPAAPLAVIDFADRGQREAPLPQLRQALARETGTVVLRHLDELSPVDMPDVAEALAVAGRSETRGPWVAATVRETGNGELSDDILCRFPCSVAIPPLRHHIEDIRELVPFLLVKQSQGAQLTCAPATLQPLLRGNWPGNIAQLQRVLRKVVAYRRSGTILPEDLPPECQAVTRRVLTPIESMERDAIVRSLLDCEGNKARAAHALGMSRATIYRKIRDYGIDVPGQPPHVSK